MDFKKLNDKCYGATIRTVATYFIEKVEGYYYIYDVNYKEVENIVKTLAEAKQYIKEMEVNS